MSTLTEHSAEIARDLALSAQRVERTLALLAEGATIPFIARYRKEATGELDEVAIAAINNLAESIQRREERRQTVLESIASQGKLDAALAERIRKAATLAEIEDLYLPWRPKRTTRASQAKARGLEPLAELLLKGTSAQITAAAADFVKTGGDVPDAAAALAGARDIIAERCSEDPPTRQSLRSLFAREAILSASLIPAMANTSEAATYQDYHDFRQKAAAMPSHRLLAIMRAVDQGVVRLRLEPDAERALSCIDSTFLADFLSRRPQPACRSEVVEACTDAWKRLLQPSLANEYLASLKEAADTRAIEVFAANVREMLLEAPFGERPILAIDPGFRTGCKVAALNAQGDLLAHAVIQPLEPHQRTAEAATIVKELLSRHKGQAIAIGNGTGGRELGAFLESIEPGVPVVMVNEAGASIYSASEIAREEFADLDLTIRSAVSIGRRLMDPLAELVKIDAKSIGVGQYQHDVDQKRLKAALDTTVSSCVNAVGVELNTASPWLLAHVAGLSPRLANAIVAHRREHGPFKSRQALLDVKGLGKKAFEQCAGFLRIRGAAEPLDASAVHPERYELVRRMAASLGKSHSEVMANPAILENLDLKSFTDQSTGQATLRDILDELRKPGRDPRDNFRLFSFADGVHNIEDLRVDMVLPGKVGNVTAFGAFVDIGVHVNGLVHISELAPHYVSDPHTVVRPGQEVQVRVLGVDTERKRISLSMKLQA